jgi:hypothetical protein
MKTPSISCQSSPAGREITPVQFAPTSWAPGAICDKLAEKRNNALQIP